MRNLCLSVECVCVCLCVRVRERGRERVWGSLVSSDPLLSVKAKGRQRAMFRSLRVMNPVAENIHRKKSCFSFKLIRFSISVSDNKTTGNSLSHRSQILINFILLIGFYSLYTDKIFVSLLLCMSVRPLNHTPPTHFSRLCENRRQTPRTTTKGLEILKLCYMFSFFFFFVENVSSFVNDAGC
jgi:hypothetical protein